MSERITFYYNPMSRGQIVHWMLEEVEADYEVRLLDWQKGDHKKADYLALNPMGKIPAIVHRGVAITESPAICAYLADAFPKKNLAPAVTTPERGAYYRWLFFASACIEPALLERTNPRTNPVPKSRLGYGDYEDVVRTIERGIHGGFLVGEHFTAADLVLSSNIAWALSQKTMDFSPTLQAYVDHCNDRPGRRRFTEKLAKMMPPTAKT